jgi:hypothetical protein
MAFKNPANISTLDDETCSKITQQGIYYSDARTRYPDTAAVVRCDKCGLCPLSCSIGLDSYDLCLPCVNSIRTAQLPVQELELDLTFRTDALNVPDSKIDTAPNSILSVIQDNLIKTMYEYLNKFACSEPTTVCTGVSGSFKLTTDEAVEFSEYCNLFLNINKFLNINDGDVNAASKFTF